MCPHLDIPPLSDPMVQLSLVLSLLLFVAVGFVVLSGVYHLCILPLSLLPCWVLVHALFSLVSLGFLNFVSFWPMYSPSHL